MRTYKTLSALVIAVVLLSGVVYPGFASPGTEVGRIAATARRANPAAPLSRAELVAAAQAEGALTVIALPADWCGYGEIIEGFFATYGIPVRSVAPGASSADELQAIRDGIGNPTEDTPDVIDVGPGFAVQAKVEGLITPYKVATWDQIPDSMKDSEGFWYGDYYGLMAIAANTTFTEAPSSWEDVRNHPGVQPAALAGDPTGSNMALFSVYAAALGNGGSAQDIEPGLRFFGDLQASGRLHPSIGGGDTLLAGETPVLLEWSYLAQAQAEENPAAGIAITIPQPAIVGFYTQAISAYAPHPNAAKLWMDYLYSDVGQLAFAQGHCIPVRFEDLNARGLIPEGHLPDPSGAVVPTVSETEAAQLFVAVNWTCMVYGFGCPPNQPTSTAECKNDGWRNYPHAGFRNQGDCVSLVSSGRFVCRDPLGCVSYGETDPVRIASALWLTDEGQLGLDAQRGVEVALGRWGEVLGHGIEVRAEDDGCSEEAGEAAANAIVADPSIAAVIGTTCSGAARTAAPILSMAGYSMVSPSSTSPYLTDPATHAAGYLRTAWNDVHNADAMAAHLVAEGEQTAFVLAQTDNFYSQTMGQAFASAFAARGGTVVGLQEVAPDDPALGDLLDAIVADGAPDVLYFPVFDPLGSQIVTAVRDRSGLDDTLMASNDALYSEDFLNRNGKAVEGMLFGLPDDSFTRFPAFADFRSRFLDVHGVEPKPFFSAHAYDATWMVLRALERTGIVDGDGALHIGRGALRDALYGTQGMIGVTGTITCDAFGDCGPTGFTVVEVGPPTLTLRVNYGHDWVEGFLPAGYTVRLTVTGSDGTAKGSAELVTEPKDFWGGGTGFQTQPSDWGAAAPNIQPGDWVIGELLETGQVDQVRIGEINGAIDVDADSVRGTVRAEWIPERVYISCDPWGLSDQGAYLEDDILPDGADEFVCSWSGILDIKRGQELGVWYYDSDGHAVVNAFSTPNTRMTVFLDRPYVEGFEWPEDATVTLTVEGKDDCTSLADPYYPEGDPNHTFFGMDLPAGCEIRPGDAVTMTDGDLSITHIVQDLEVTGVDVETNIVHGRADYDPAMYLLHAWIHGLDNTYTQPAVTDGVWEVDYGEMGFDLQPGMAGRAELVDQASNATAVDWHISNPHFTVFPEGEWMDGYDWPAGPVLVSVAGKPECSITMDSPGGFFNGAFPGGCDVAVGDVVAFDQGPTHREHQVRNLAITGVDPGTNTVQGTADDGAAVHAWVHGYGQTDTWLTAAGGTWSTNFGGFDLVEGMCGRSEIQDDQGNSTAVDWCIPNPRLTVWPESDRMDGGEWPDGPVAVTVDGKPQCSTVKISEGGYFNEPFPEDCDIVVNDRVTFTAGETTRWHDVRNLAITAVDMMANTVAGTADTGEEVSIGAYGFGGENEVWLTVEDGTWLADFSTTGVELDEGMCGYARIDDDLGNVTQVDWCVPLPG